MTNILPEMPSQEAGRIIHHVRWQHQLQTSQKLTVEQRAEAFHLLDTGMSLRQVARRFGVNAESLRRLVRRHKSA